jgi:hypothetical protein
VPEVAAFSVCLGVPVVRELELSLFLMLGREKHERESAGLVIVAANFLEAELVAVEIQRRVEIGHAYHCVQIAHHLSSREFN